MNDDTDRFANVQSTVVTEQQTPFVDTAKVS